MTAYGADSSTQRSWLAQFGANASATLRILFRAPRHNIVWPSAVKVLLAPLVAAGAILLSMTFLDVGAAHFARRLPVALIDAARSYTKLGLGGWFLWPTGIVLVLLSAIDTPRMAHFSRAVLAAFAVRVGFVFTAMAVPGVIGTIIKHLVGRARPFVRGDNVWAYSPFNDSPAYASFPSGHTNTAFAALVALGAIFPQARALLWIYAVLIGCSRIIINAHYPSDVIAGAVLGAGGAWLVRNWFAARGLGFAVKPNGAIVPMPGPSLRRIAKAVAARARAA